MKLKIYTPEFRAEAVKLVLAQGLTLEEAAQRVAIPKGTLANWVSAAKRSKDPAAAPGSRSVAELETEVARLAGPDLRADAHDTYGWITQAILRV
jgi:transposase